MKITEVRFFQVAGRTDLPEPEERQSQMLDIYPEFGARGPGARSADGVLKATYVEIVTDEGLDAGFLGRSSPRSSRSSAPASRHT